MSPTRRTASGRSTITSTRCLSSSSAMRVSRGLALMMISRRIHLQGGIGRSRVQVIDRHGPPERRLLERLQRREKRDAALHPHRLARDEEQARIELERRQETLQEKVRPQITRGLEPRRERDAQRASLGENGNFRDAGPHVDRASLLSVALL